MVLPLFARGWSCKWLKRPRDVPSAPSKPIVSASFNKSLLYGPFYYEASVTGEGKHGTQRKGSLTKPQEGRREKDSVRFASHSTLHPPGNQSLTLSQDTDARGEVLPSLEYYIV